MQYLDTQDFRRLSAPQYQGFLDRVFAITETMRRFTEMGLSDRRNSEMIEWRICESVSVDVLFEHYPVGSVFDYHGIAAMVVDVSVVEDDRIGPRNWRNWKVTAALKVGDSIEHITISHALALALIWRRYNLEDTPQ
jgi:hypothetical protein